MKSFPAAGFGCRDARGEGELIHQPGVRGTGWNSVEGKSLRTEEQEKWNSTAF